LRDAAEKQHVVFSAERTQSAVPGKTKSLLHQTDGAAGRDSRAHVRTSSVLRAEIVPDDQPWKACV
jgi:hypothetical protein